MSKRRELENYAQNVLRPNLCKAKDMQIHNLSTAFLCVCVIIVLSGLWLILPSPNEGFVVLVCGFHVAVVAMIALFRLRYWRQVELLILDRIAQIMVELQKPGEPEKEPADFAVSMVELSFERTQYVDLLLNRFRRQPELVFPSPSASDLV